jgi:hypothetical protein
LYLRFNYHMFVNTALKYGKINWFKTICNDLKSQPTTFCVYRHSEKEFLLHSPRSYSYQFSLNWTGRKILVKHFHSVYSNSITKVYHSPLLSSQVLQLLFLCTKTLTFLENQLQYFSKTDCIILIAGPSIL